MTGTPGRPHRGRRDNGLDATDFVALADVDPRIGEHLLDVLGIVGIAAYLAPSADLNPVVRSTSLPARPTDRLWVDRDRLDEARGLLEAVQEDDAARPADATAGQARPAEIDVDVEWERIVAGYDATAAPDRPRRRARAEPTEETGSAEAPALTDPTADPLPVRTPGTADQPAPPAEPEAEATPVEAPEDPKPDPPTEFRPLDLTRPVGRDRLTGTDAPPSDFPTDDDEGYEPPPPPPLPRLSLPVVAAVLAIVAGLVLLFRSDTLGLSEHVRLLLSLCGILGGAGALVWRLRDGWNDDDPDDGAVV